MSPSTQSTTTANPPEGSPASRHTLLSEYKMVITGFFAFDLLWHFAKHSLLPSAAPRRTTRQTATVFAVWSALGYGTSNMERWAAESWAKDRAVMLEWWQEKQKHAQMYDHSFGGDVAAVAVADAGSGGGKERNGVRERLLPGDLQGGGLKDARGRTREDRYLSAYGSAVIGLGGTRVLTSYKPVFKAVLGRPGNILALFLIGYVQLVTAKGALALGSLIWGRRQLEARVRDREF